MKKLRTGLLLAERACNICFSIALFSLSKSSISCSSLGHILLPELPQFSRQFDDLVSRKDEQGHEHHSHEPEVMLAEFDFGDDRSDHYEERQEDCANEGRDFENLVHITD